MQSKAIVVLSVSQLRPLIRNNNTFFTVLSITRTQANISRNNVTRAVLPYDPTLAVSNEEVERLRILERQDQGQLETQLVEYALTNEVLHSSISVQVGPEYFERQKAANCGKHTLNNLVQHNYFNETGLRAISREVRKRDQGDIYQHADNTGNYSIEVLQEALKRTGFAVDGLLEIELEDWIVNGVPVVMCIVATTTHYFALRRFNLNTPPYVIDSLSEGPIAVRSGEQLEQYLKQKIGNQVRYYQVFSVKSAINVDQNNNVEMEFNYI